MNMPEVKLGKAVFFEAAIYCQLPYELRKWINNLKIQLPNYLLSSANIIDKTPC